MALDCVCVCVYKWVDIQTSATLNTVASFIESAIHHGRPPVITSVLGGTVRQIIPILFLLVDIIFKIVSQSLNIKHSLGIAVVLG